MNYQMLLLMMAVGGLIGYSTNKIAVKMLFRPHRRINFFLFSIQGVLPKRKSDIATSVGETVENALINQDDIYRSMFTEETREYFKETLKTNIASRIGKFIPSMFKTMLGGDIDTLVAKFIDSEGDRLLDEMLSHLQETSRDNIRIKEIVESKINALDLDEFETMVKDLVRRELRHIETIGLILGLMIGFFQFLLTTLL